MEFKWIKFLAKITASVFAFTYFYMGATGSFVGVTPAMAQSNYGYSDSEAYSDSGYNYSDSGYTNDSDYNSSPEDICSVSDPINYSWVGDLWDEIYGTIKSFCFVCEPDTEKPTITVSASQKVIPARNGVTISLKFRLTDNYGVKKLIASDGKYWDIDKEWDHIYHCGEGDGTVYRGVRKVTFPDPNDESQVVYSQYFKKTYEDPSILVRAVDVNGNWEHKLCHLEYNHRSTNPVLVNCI